MKDYLLILKGDGMNHISQDEEKSVHAKYTSWASNLGDNYKGGQRLEDGGVMLTDKSADVITDGPFLEAAEMIAGFMQLQAESLEDAIKIAQELPHLGLYKVEVRPIAMISKPQ